MQLLTVDEACRMLKISRKTLYNDMKRGKFSVVKLSNRAIRIRETDIMSLIAERTICYEPTEKTEKVAQKILEKILNRG